MHVAVGFSTSYCGRSNAGQNGDGCLNPPGDMLSWRATGADYLSNHTESMKPLAMTHQVNRTIASNDGGWKLTLILIAEAILAIVIGVLVGVGGAAIGLAILAGFGAAVGIALVDIILLCVALSQSDF